MSVGSEPDTGTGPTTGDAVAPGRRKLAWIVGPLVVAVIALGVVLGVVLAGGQDPVDHRFVIAAGTGAKIDAGRLTAAFPTNLEVHVGDRLIIVNHDNRIHTFGPFAVRPDETFTFTFPAPAKYRGICTANPSGETVITAI